MNIGWQEIAVILIVLFVVVAVFSAAVALARKVWDAAGSKGGGTEKPRPSQ